MIISLQMKFLGHFIHRGPRPIWLFSLCTIILFFTSCSAKENDDNWDYVLFTQQWPITACIDHKSEKPHSSCTLYLNMTSWTVHGIWPTLHGTKGPNFCNNSWHFDEEQLKSIEPFLLKYWSNIFADTSLTSLWKHEWTKHGTCAALLTELNSELKYFSQGIQWAMKYDFVAILGNWKIYPDDANSYRLDDIYGVIKFYLGVNPIIDCIYNSKEEVHELSQIKLCFDRQLKLVDCDLLSNGGDALKILGNCPPKGIIYPSSVKASNGTVYRYPLELAAKHTSTWNEAERSWSQHLFSMLKTVRALTFLAL